MNELDWLSYIFPMTDVPEQKRKQREVSYWRAVFPAIRREALRRKQKEIEEIDSLKDPSWTETLRREHLLEDIENIRRASVEEQDL